MCVVGKLGTPFANKTGVTTGPRKGCAISDETMMANN